MGNLSLQTEYRKCEVILTVNPAGYAVPDGGEKAPGADDQAQVQKVVGNKVAQLQRGGCERR
jgi:hypothetical protein